MALVDFKITLTSEVDSTNEDVGDLFLEEDGAIGVTRTDTEDDQKRATAQGLRTRLNLVKGEYFLNIREGIPYFTEIFVKNPSFALIRSILLQTILSYPGIRSIPQPGVNQVTSLDLGFDKNTRELEVDFTAQIDPGVEIVSSDYGPLLLDLSLKSRKNQ